MLVKNQRYQIGDKVWVKPLGRCGLIDYYDLERGYGIKDSNEFFPESELYYNCDNFRILRRAK